MGGETFSVGATHLDDTALLMCLHDSNCTCTAVEHSKDMTNSPPNSKLTQSNSSKVPTCTTPSHHLISDHTDFIDSTLPQNYVDLFAGTSLLLQYHARDPTCRVP